MCQLSLGGPLIVPNRNHTIESRDSLPLLAQQSTPAGNTDSSAYRTGYFVGRWVVPALIVLLIVRYIRNKRNKE
jgi:hypothetical protein